MTDWARIADLVLAILEKIQDHSHFFEAEARKRGVTVSQLTAAAITEAVRQQVEGFGRRQPSG